MGISIWQLLIILVIVILLFGTKRLRSLGTDLGGAIKSFRSAVKEGEDDEKPQSESDNQNIEPELKSTNKDKH
ncbi:MAG TPA: twin-arginine translocase TatA/TatE family subunit [Methylococcaceae bacterium]|jgi:sec-independent protein translocase protein TatA|nr:twin-arginine translocase TatA/TatE family subunit [Methylococcaceae bacterium]HIN68174.1 twin-arginine translocase TatA/TatE family subunit [Methylococcales bacterium]HIA45911.1 twin-arginine translocase TatA/TatE family subunit [Methylococcaceae bacterium]HIB63433.1 twin-arginine translocase TatA/TatE family subunit [Methylococcaceae bacterium]HIO12522.1 twin-arginine translocase TatA/TatE family subunit [Methylococcales bacterium]